MKAKNICIVVILSFFLTIAFHHLNAQAKVNVNINLQPDWGPAGYDYVEYYYLPAYQVYYYVPKRQFVYLDGPNWRFVTALPPRFGTIDFYNTYKVVINEPKAYLHYKTHKVKYTGGGPKQVVIRDSKTKYMAKPSNAGPKKSTAPKSSPGHPGGNKGGGHGKGKGGGKH